MTYDPSAATEALAGDAAAAGEAVGSADAAPTVAPDAKAAAQAGQARLRLLAVTRRLGGFAFTLALLVVGAWAGSEAFRNSQPVAAPPANPAVAGVPAPAVVQEFAAAIESNDTDRVRTSMAKEIFDTYASELQKYSLSTVDSVEIVGTLLDGPRTATMLVLTARRTDTSPFALFLVVQTQDGQIVRLR